MSPPWFYREHTQNSEKHSVFVSRLANQSKKEDSQRTHPEFREALRFRELARESVNFWLGSCQENVFSVSSKDGLMLSVNTVSSDACHDNVEPRSP